VQPSPHAEPDEVKECQTKMAEAQKEEREKKPKQGWSPQPAYAIGSAMGAVAGHARQRHSKKMWGSLILLGIILYPIQKKLSTAKTLLKL